MNGDGLDPNYRLNWWNYGYLYPPSSIRTRGTGYEYVRHGKGGNYAWADGHVNMTTWEVMSTGKNGKIDWYYMPTPSSVPRPK